MPDGLLPAETRQRLLAGEPRGAALAALALYAGLRASELAALRRGDVDPEAGQVRVAGASVYLHPHAASALRRYLGTRPGAPPEAPLFPARGGGPLSRVQVWRLVRRAGGELALPPRALRLDCGLRLLAGVGGRALARQHLRSPRWRAKKSFSEKSSE